MGTYQNFLHVSDDHVYRQKLLLAPVAKVKLDPVQQDGESPDESHAFAILSHQIESMEFILLGLVL